MKVSVALLFVVLVAGAAAVQPLKTRENKVIEDAMEIYQCLIQSIAILQDSIDGLLATITGVTGVIDDIRGLFADCLAIGGENPSIIDQIQQVVCISGLRDSIEAVIGSKIAEVQNSAAQVVIAGSNVAACFD